MLEQSVVIATGVLNSMHINQGFNSKAPGESGFDYTQFATLKVPEHGLLYYRTYEDMQWRKVDVTRMDLSKAKVLRLRSEENVRDVTANFV